MSEFEVTTTVKNDPLIFFLLLSTDFAVRNCSAISRTQLNKVRISKK